MLFKEELKTIIRLHKLSKMVWHQATWLAQLDNYWFAEQEATGSNPSQTNTQGLWMMEEKVLPFY